MAEPEEIIEAQYRDISGETELERIKKHLNNRRLACIRAVEEAQEILIELSSDVQKLSPEDAYGPSILYARGVIAGDFFREVGSFCESVLNDIHAQTSPSIMVPDTTIVDSKGNPIGQVED